jgi:glycosyltransferase involved in cell wall biosynthesis
VAYGLGRPTNARAFSTRIGFDARYVNDRYHGIGRHAYGLLEAVTRLSPQQEFFVYVNPTYPNTRFDLGTLAKRNNVRLCAVRLALYAPLAQLAWPIVLARDGIDIFHSPYVDTPILATVRLAPTVHDLIFERFPAYMPQRGFRLLYRVQMQLAMRRASCVLTVSDATRADLSDYYPAARKKVFVVGNAVAADFRPVHDPDQLASVRERYGLPPRFVLAVGAGRPHKNLEVLVDAFARLDPHANAGIVLVLGGDLDTRFPDEVGQRIAAHGLADRVLRLGGIRETDLPALYSLAEVFVFPSLVEGFGLPLLEAMACGTPVIASRSSSMPEVAGDACLLFSPRDAARLTELMAALLNAPELRIEQARRGRVQAQNFTWDKVGQTTLRAYDSMLREHPAQPNN